MSIPFSILLIFIIAICGGGLDSPEMFIALFKIGLWVFLICAALLAIGIILSAIKNAIVQTALYQRVKKYIHRQKEEKRKRRYGRYVFPVIVVSIITAVFCVQFMDIDHDSISTAINNGHPLSYEDVRASYDAVKEAYANDDYSGTVRGARFFLEKYPLGEMAFQVKTWYADACINQMRDFAECGNAASSEVLRDTVLSLGVSQETERRAKRLYSIAKAEAEAIEAANEIAEEKPHLPDKSKLEFTSYRTHTAGGSVFYGAYVVNNGDDTFHTVKVNGSFGFKGYSKPIEKEAFAIYDEYDYPMKPGEKRFFAFSFSDRDKDEITSVSFSIIEAE